MKEKNEKRNKLLLASMTLIKKNGFERTSVSQIVKEAGVAQGTFYLYFHSKNALVPAIASQIFDEQLFLIKNRYDDDDSMNSLEDLLQILVDVTYEITEKHKDLINFLYSGFAYDNSFETWENIYRPYYSWLETSLKSLKEKSLLTIEMNYSYLANFVVGLIEHGAESVFLSNSSAEEKNRSKEQLLRLLNHALEPKLYI
jgi:AcrR family transcriptional regulator